MVNSARKYLDSGYEIIQCSDNETLKLNGVDRIFRIEGDKDNLMLFRMNAFSKLGLLEKAIYVDSDLLFVAPLKEPHLTAILTSDIAICERSFNKDLAFNVSFRDLNLSEYSGKNLNDVYPFLACFTATRSHIFWDKCFDTLLKLDKKFHFWYGDQEAIKSVIHNFSSLVYLPESYVACLPEFLDRNNLPLAIHFKGLARKNLMLQYGTELNIF
jgi:hypothetical protein